MLPNKISIISTLVSDDEVTGCKLAKMVLVEFFTPADKDERAIPPEDFIFNCSVDGKVIHIDSSPTETGSYTMDAGTSLGLENQLTPMLEHELLERIPMRIKHFCDLNERKKTISDLILLVVALVSTLKDQEQLSVTIKENFMNHNLGYARSYQLLDAATRVHTFLDYNTMMSYYKKYNKHYRAYTTGKRCKILDKRITF